METLLTYALYAQTRSIGLHLNRESVNQEPVDIEKMVKFVDLAADYYKITNGFVHDGYVHDLYETLKQGAKESGWEEMYQESLISQLKSRL